MGFLGGLGGQESPSLRLLRLLRLQCQAGRQPTADKCITFVKIVITWNESHYAFARGALQRTINIMIENVFTQVYSITNMSRISLRGYDCILGEVSGTLFKNQLFLYIVWEHPKIIHGGHF